jgi:hypothetical protein
MARLYDTWNSITKMNYNPDGSMKESWRQTLLNDGRSLDTIEYLENQKMLEVKNYDEREEDWLKRDGITYSEWEAQGRESDAELKRRQKSALRNCEDISELPMDIDPDDYYDSIGNAGIF